jgi:hypothetical protein
MRTNRHLGSTSASFVKPLLQGKNREKKKCVKRA